jgi:hypothetical protein
MRNTVHLVAAEDYIRFRPLFQLPMDRALSGTFGGRLTLLVDGFWQADWKISKDRGVLEIRPFAALGAADRAAITAGAERLLDFAGPAGTARDVRFVPDGN